MATKKSSNSNAQMDLLVYEMTEIKELTREHKVALVGKDGIPGLVGNYASMCLRVESLEKLLQNDLAHIQATLDVKLQSLINTFEIRFQQKDIIDTAKEEGRKMAEEVKKENTVTWSSLLRDWFKPVATALVTSLVWWLMTK